MTSAESALDRLHRSLAEFSTDLGALGFAQQGLANLTLVLTTACNLRCSYCYADNKVDRIMKWGVVGAALDLLRRRGLPDADVLLYGGEPLVHPGMVRRVVEEIEAQWSLETRPGIILCTNGTLLDSETLAWLVDHDVALQISSDGVEPAQQLRGVDTFKVLDRVFRDVRRRFPDFFDRRVSAKLTLSSGNMSHLSASVRYLMSLGIRRIEVVPLNTHDTGWNETSSVVLERELRDLRHACLDSWQQTGEFPCTLFQGPAPHGERPEQRTTMCGIGSGTGVTVDVDGTTTLCDACIESFQRVRGPMHGSLLEMARICNIRDSSFDGNLAAACRRVRSHGLFANRRHKTSGYGKCRACSYISECSVCPASIANIPRNTDLDRIPTNQCDFNMVSARQRELFRRDVERATEARARVVSPA